MILIVIASLVPDEQQATNNKQQTEASGLTQNGTTSQTDTPASSSTYEAENSENISGTWDEISAAEPATFVFTQNGSQLGVQLQLSGQLLGTGSGEIHGRQVVLNVPVASVVTTMNATLSDDGNTIIGTYHVPATGFSETVKLVKRGY